MRLISRGEVVTAFVCCAKFWFHFGYRPISCDVASEQTALPFFLPLQPLFSDPSTATTSSDTRGEQQAAHIPSTWSIVSISLIWNRLSRCSIHILFTTSARANQPLSQDHEQQHSFTYGRTTHCRATRLRSDSKFQSQHEQHYQNISLADHAKKQTDILTPTALRHIAAPS